MSIILAITSLKTDWFLPAILDPAERLYLQTLFLQKIVFIWIVLFFLGKWLKLYLALYEKCFVAVLVAVS